MRKLKFFAALFCAVMCIFSFSLSSFAADIDLGAWNTDSTLYSVLDESTESNCAAEYIFLRVKYDKPSNRIKLLFMLNLTSFSQEEKAGVTMSINGGEKITLHLNGNSEYNEDKYFVEIKSDSDTRTKTLLFEVILGIKQGVPDSVVLDFNIYDTEGVASNTYSVDISEKPEEPDTTTSQAEKTSKTQATKTTKVKTAKIKTTKVKSTKESVSTKTNVTGQTDEESQVMLNNNEKHNDSETRVNEKKVIAIAAAVTLAVIGIGAGGVHFFRNKKKKGTEAN